MKNLTDEQIQNLFDSWLIGEVLKLAMTDQSFAAELRGYNLRVEPSRVLRRSEGLYDVLARYLNGKALPEWEVPAVSELATRAHDIFGEVASSIRPCHELIEWDNGDNDAESER